MSEWLKEHAWKACVGETLPCVRIPLSPPQLFFRNPLNYHSSLRRRLYQQTSQGHFRRYRRTCGAAICRAASRREGTNKKATRTTLTSRTSRLRRLPVTVCRVE